MLVLLCAMMLCTLYSRVCLPYQEDRDDTVRLSDHLLDLLPTRDLSVPLYLVTNLSVVATTWELLLLQDFYAVEKFYFTFALCMVVKSLTLFTTPLEVPDGYIPLRDPVCALLTRREVTYARDLFFSGHTAMMALCVLNAQSDGLRTLSALGTIGVAVGLLVHRVHYTVDVVLAPFVSYGCYRFVEWV